MNSSPTLNIKPVGQFLAIHSLSEANGTQCEKTMWDCLGSQKHPTGKKVYFTLQPSMAKVSIFFFLISRMQGNCEQRKD